MINIIAAMTEEGVIGKGNQLPWHLPEDLANFKKLTLGNTVVMGRKTYESIPKKFRPLANRHNVVISLTMPSETGIVVCSSLEEALTAAQTYGKETFIIGGASIYQQALAVVEKMYISYVKQKYEGDAYFPEFNKDDWAIGNQQDFQDFKLVIYEKKKISLL